MGLPFLSALVRTSIQAESIEGVITTLCYAVNSNSSNSWQIAKLLLRRRDLGATVAASLLGLLGRVQLSTYILRGAVFFVGMSCWGSQRLFSLQYPFAVVVPQMRAVIACRKLVVVYEVLLSIRRLVKAFGASLRSEWDDIFAILLASRPYVTSAQRSNSLVEVIADITSAVQTLQVKMLPAPPASRRRTACVQSEHQVVEDSRLLELLRVFSDIIDDATLDRTFAMVAERVHPAFGEWRSMLNWLLRSFFLESQSEARCLSALAVLETKLRTHRAHAEELVREGLLEMVLPALLSRRADDVKEAPVWAAGAARTRLQAAVAEMVARLARDSLLVELSALVRAIEGLLVANAAVAEDASKEEAAAVAALLGDKDRACCAALDGLLELAFRKGHAEAALAALHGKLRLIGHRNATVRQNALLCIARLTADGTGVVGLRSLGAVLSSRVLGALAAATAAAGRVPHPLLRCDDDRASVAGSSFVPADADVKGGDGVVWGPLLVSAVDPSQSLAADVVEALCKRLGVEESPVSPALRRPPAGGRVLSRAARDDCRTLWARCSGAAACCRRSPTS